jgi:hypothetical protein
MHGFETTVPVTLYMMILQGHAVMRGSKRALVEVDPTCRSRWRISIRRKSFEIKYLQLKLEITPPRLRRLALILLGFFRPRKALVQAAAFPLPPDQSRTLALIG